MSAAAPVRTCYTIADLERRFGVHDRTIRKWVAEGKLPRPLPLGRCYRWDVQAFEAWVARHSEGLDNATP